MNPFVEGIYVTYNFRHVSLQYTNNNAVKTLPESLRKWPDIFMSGFLREILCNNGMCATTQKLY